MDAIILAGGLGTRLRSVVTDIPKCMAPVCEKPFLHYILEYLKGYQVDRVILSLGYLNEVVISWVESMDYPFQFVYSIEDEPLGTGGAIRKALVEVQSKQVLILNGDTFFNVDLNMLYSQHTKNGALLSLALRPMVNFDRYGAVHIDDFNHICAFKEKSWYKEGLINGGVYIIESKNRLMENLPNKFSFETEVLEPLVSTKSMYGFVYSDYFIDIGIPSDYYQAETDFQTMFL
jgi:D-glycero-alpha-D-manno-heptose 1-phosphate guanylyltransferase